MEKKQLKLHIYQNGKLNSNRTHSYYIKSKFPDLYNRLNFNGDELKFKQLLYDFIFDINKPPKCQNPKCNKDVTFQKFSKGYSKYCSYKCAYGDFKNNEEAINKIKNTQINKRNEKIKLKYIKDFPNLKINNDDIILKEYCIHGDLKIKIKKFQNNINNHAQTHCDKCHNYYLKLFIPDNNIIIKQHELFINMINKNKYNITEKKIKKYYPILYKCIINTTPKNSLWQEQVYTFKNKISTRPKCINCNIHETHFQLSTHEYSKHCNICCDNGDFIINYKKFISKIETDVFNYLSILYNGKIIRNLRLNKNEIDIFLPDENIGIEFNGLYWHSTKFRKRSYHFDKYMFLKNKSIVLFTIWEDDWLKRRPIIESMITNKLGLNVNKIAARQCQIKEITSKENHDFCDANHIQGKVSASVRYGLFYKGELVSIMTFGKRRSVLGQKSADKEYELLRFCNKLNTSVVGGASKLYSHFLKDYDPDVVISYASCDHSSGNLYKVLGFKDEGHTGVNYWWAKGSEKYHRSQFMKHKLVKEGFNPDKTENEIMEERGFNKVYGAGNLKYVWNKKIILNI